LTIRAVVFDLDGTITRFNLDYRAVRAEVISLLTRAGMPASALSMNESTFGMLRKTETFMKINGKTEVEAAKVIGEALALIEEREMEAAKNTELMSGVLETLKALKGRGLKIGLCTINGKKSTEHILNRFGIEKRFDAVITRDKVRSVKPNTEHLQTVLDVLDVSANEAVIVGDGPSDMRCGKELKVIAVGLPTGESSQETLAECGANYVITALTDLPELIEHINKATRMRMK